MMQRITIAGDIGSGKTTIARIVAERLGVAPLSTGGIQRQLAASKGIDTITLNRLAEHDPSIDEAIDSHLRALPAGPLVVESRMAWRFVPDTLKVFLYVVPQAAAERIFSASRGDERYLHRQQALEAIKVRRGSEIHRFSKYYSVDISHLQNYDLILDTTHETPEQIAERILVQQTKPAAPELWLSPLDMLPTQGLPDGQEHKAQSFVRAVQEGSFQEAPPISVLYVGHIFYIADGHARVAAAVQAGATLVPASLLASDREAYGAGVTAERYVKDSVSESLIAAWENSAGIKYQQLVREWIDC